MRNDKAKTISFLVVVGLLFPGIVWAAPNIFRGDESYKDLAELALGDGMFQLTARTKKDIKYNFFSTTNYGHTKLKTIANTKVDGFGELIGVGRRFLVGKGKFFSGGLYYEFARNKSKTQTGNVSGDGDGYKRGFGVMGRLDVQTGNYYEWLLHLGKSNNRFSNSQGMNYENTPRYLGAAMTYGHRFNLSKNSFIAPHLTYLYTNTRRANSSMGTYDFSFDDVKSHKTKLGVRYLHEITRGKVVARPYVVLAWDHEFDGKAVIHINTPGGVVNPESPDVRGDTGCLEFGCKWETKNWNVGVGVEGYAGKRQGWNATLAAVYTF